MPWIKVIPEHEAEGELKEVYRKIREQRKSEKINQDRDAGHSGPPVSPPSCAVLIPGRCGIRLSCYVDVKRGESRLTTAQREMIATVTSATLHCRF